MEPTPEDLELEELLPMWVDETGMLIDTTELMSVTAKPRLFANRIDNLNREEYTERDIFLTEGVL